MSTKRDPSKWVTRTCLMCEKEFEVRLCYAKRGNVKFCSRGCKTRHMNLTNNPSWNPETRKKISENHADVSGENNPMHGRKGKDAPGWIDGRNSTTGNTWRKIALTNKPHDKCEHCGYVFKAKKEINVHHVDQNQKNNHLDNLMILCTKCHNTVFHKHKRNNLGQFEN